MTAPPFPFESWAEVQLYELELLVRQNEHGKQAIADGTCEQCESLYHLRYGLDKHRRLSLAYAIKNGVERWRKLVRSAHASH